jgi:hypothetical protein
MRAVLRTVALRAEHLAVVRQANGKAAPGMVEPKHILGRQFFGVTDKNPSHLIPRSMGPRPDAGR